MGSPSLSGQLLQQASTAGAAKGLTHGDWWLRHFPCLQFHFLGWHVRAGGGGVVPAFAGGGVPALAGGGLPAFAGGGVPVLAGGGLTAFAGGGVPVLAGGGLPAFAGGGVPALAGGGLPAFAGGGVPALAGGGLPACGGGIAMRGAAGEPGGGTAVAGGGAPGGGLDTALGGGGTQLQTTGTCLGRMHARQLCYHCQEGRLLLSMTLMVKLQRMQPSHHM